MAAKRSSTSTSRPTTSRTAIHEGDRQLRRAGTRFGEEFRLIRLRAGVSQAAVARAIGVDRACICRIEAGDPTVSDRTRARAAAVLGADFRLGIYPDAAPLIHDAAHARIVEALVRMRHPSWRARVEAPVPGVGRRSTDLRLDRGAETVLFEVETHVHALEAIIRECQEKRSAVAADAAGVTNAITAANAQGAMAATPAGTSGDAALVAGTAHVRRVYAVLVLPPTHHHRALVLAHPGTIKAVFPAPAADARRALASVDTPWPGDGIFWLGPGRQPADRRVAANGVERHTPSANDRR